MAAEHGYTAAVRSFRLEITSIEDFAAFVALVRGDELTDRKLLELTSRLTKSAADLKAAEDANAPSTD